MIRKLLKSIIGLLTPFTLLLVSFIGLRVVYNKNTPAAYRCIYYTRF